MDDRPQGGRETGRHKDRLLILHPLLFVASPILILYWHNIDQVPFSHVVPMLAAAQALTGCLWLALRWLFKDPLKSALMVSTASIFFFSYGHIHNLALGALNATVHRRAARSGLLIEESIFLHSLLTVICVLACAYLIYKIIKARSPLAFFNRLANMAASTLVLMSLVGIASYKIGATSVRRDRPLQPASAASPVGERPDIYCIILDGYGRADILKEYFGYDNSAFLGFLRGLGFTIAEESRSNYNWTFLSLASTLNLDYINDLADVVDRGSRDSRIPYDMIKNSKIVETLKANGYRYVHFSSTWGATQSSPQADVEIAFKKGGFHSEFSRLLLSTTLLKSSPVAEEAELATRHLYGLEKLRSVCGLPGPKFVFYHLLPPHHPYIFDREGKVKRHAYLSNQFEFDKLLWKEKGQYIDQLRFVTGKIELAIGDILRNSPRPPVIVLQSDHGPTLTDVPQDDFLRSRFAILNALCLPSGTNAFYGSITPVNTFRIILNALFGSGLPILEDQSYFSEFDHPYDFRKISWPAPETRDRR